MTATTAVSGRTAAATASGRTRPFGLGRDDVELVPVRDQRLGGAHHRRVLERADDEVAAARRARRAQHPQRVGLGAAAGEDDLLRLGAQRRRDLAARRLEGARRRRPRRVGRGRVGEVGAGRRGRRREHLGGRPRRGGVVQVNHGKRL